MVAEEIVRRLAAAEAVGVIKEAAVQVFVLQPGIQSAAVLAQVGDGSGFIGKQIAQRQAYCCKSATMPRTLCGRLAPASCASLFWGSGNRAGWHRKHR